MSNTIAFLEVPAPVLGRVINAIRITEVIVDRFSSARINVEIGEHTPESGSVEDETFAPESFSPLSFRQVRMTPEQYIAWGNNDRYVFEVAAEQIGLTLKPES
jgi:hypothetical protein